MKVGLNFKKEFSQFSQKFGNITPTFPSISYPMPNSKVNQQFDPK